MHYLYRKNLSNFMYFTEILKCFIVSIMGLIPCSTVGNMYKSGTFHYTNSFALDSLELK